MFKIIIFLIFTLIMIKISWPDIFNLSPPPSVIANDSKKPGNLTIYQRFMRFFLLLFYRAKTLTQILFSDTHDHKFYRFFAFEFLFILILVNFGYWLRNPFTVFRIFTWIILLGSFVLAGYAIYHLLEYGKPQISGKNETANSSNKSLIYKYIQLFLYRLRILSGIEKTTILVTTGIYKYIRHPLYSALIIMGTVTLLKNDFPWLMAICLFVVATVFFYTTALMEEKENLIKFGDDYAAYMERTGMFFPLLP